MQLIRRFRGLAVALAVLAISAGAVFAGAPHFAPATAPVAQFDPAADPTPAPDEDGDEDEDEDGDEDEDAGEEAETSEEGPKPDSHGFMVSTAAQMETPEGFANHGAFVSCIAHMTEVVDPTAVTLEQCLAASEAKAAEKATKGAEKAAEKMAEKAARAAAKAAAGKTHGHGKPSGG